MQAPQRAATTAFTRLRTYCDGGFTLLRATLVEGGRQHQIRRHLNSVAHQVVGDTQYGKSRINAMLQAVVSRAIVSRATVSESFSALSCYPVSLPIDLSIDLSNLPLSPYLLTRRSMVCRASSCTPSGCASAWTATR